jgi:hypothetical protein
MGTVTALKVHNVNLKYSEIKLDIIIITIIIIIYFANPGDTNVDQERSRVDFKI